MEKVIAIAAQKEGCGKTNVLVNLAAALIKEGESVLAADVDPQGSCTVSLGFAKPDGMDYTLANIIRGNCE